MRHLSAFVWAIYIFSIAVPANMLALVLWDVSIMPLNGLMEALIHLIAFIAWGAMMVGFLTISLDQVVSHHGGCSPEDLGIHDTPTIIAARTEIKGLANEAGLERAPRLTVAESEEINAMAVSNWFGRSVICITTQALSLPVAELRALIAHEIGHIARGDSLVVAFIHSVIYKLVFEFLEEVGSSILWVAKGMIWFTVIGSVIVLAGAAVADVDPLETIQPLYIVFFIALASFIAVPIWKYTLKTNTHLLHHALGRHLEMKADELGARLTSPDLMIRLLQRLKTVEEQQSGPTQYNAFSTHPSFEKRIKRLTKISKSNTN